MSSKTEAPTKKRLRLARRAGDSPISLELSRTIALAAVFGLLPISLSWLAEREARRLRSILDAPLADGTLGLAPLARTAIDDLQWAALPILLVAALATLATGWAQTGRGFALRALAPDLSRIQPRRAWDRLLAPERLFGVARGSTLALVAGATALYVLVRRAPDLADATGNAVAGRSLLFSVLQTVGWSVTAVAFILALLDARICYQAFISRHRMTRFELQRERREQQGSPELKLQLRRSHGQLWSMQAAQALEEATVMVVAPSRVAVALRYRSDKDSAPLVLCRGEGPLVGQWLQLASSRRLRVLVDPRLALRLARQNPGAPIGPDLYEDVAAALTGLTSDQE